MKKLLAILSLAVIFLSSGCLLSNDSKKEDNGGNGGTAVSNKADTYLPYMIGATWSYEATESIDRDKYIFTEVETVVGTNSYGGENYWLIEEKINYEKGFSSRDRINERFVRIDGNTVCQFLSLSIDPMPILKFGLSSGQTWIVNESNESSSYSWLSTGKYLGIETVQVPAGTFQNCAKFRFDSAATGTTGWSQTSISMEWYAPKVGLVKKTDVMVTNTGKEYAENHTDTVTAALTSYSIPK